MDIKFITVIASILFCFLGGFLCMSFSLKKDFFDNKPNSVIAFSLFLPSLFCIFILALVMPDFNDFIYDPNIFNILITLLCIVGLWFLSIFTSNYKYFLSAVFISCLISAFTLPTDSLIFQIDKLPWICDRLLLVVIWFIFSSFYYVINSIDGIQPLQTMGICLGLFLISIIGGAPFTYGLFALCIFSAAINYCIFNWYPARFTLDKRSSQVLGFMLGWLMSINSSEGIFSQTIILTSFYWIELFHALGQRITFIEKFSNLNSNTICYQTNVSGISPNQLSVLIFKILILLVLFSLFQLYAPNSYSLPILAIITTFWFMYKIKNWQTPQPTLKEINQNFVNDLNQGIKNLKNINKD